MKPGYKPDVRYDRSALGEVVTIMDIVFRHSVRDGYAGISGL